VNIKTILVPTDFSKDADAALATAEEFAPLFGAKIVLLHAYHIDIPIQPPGLGGGMVLPPEFVTSFREEARRRVEELAANAGGRGVEIAAHVDPAPAHLAILAYAEQLPADLIIMGTRGLTGVKHLMLGSVAERVVREAPCPVLTLKAEDDETA